jgi:glutamyl-tRNA synthetase
VLGPDGARLAKRHGAVTLADRLERGETPAQVRGELMASVGLAEPGSEPSMAELLDAFARAGAESLPRAATVLQAA